MKKALTIGLTGQTGAGKSTVADKLSQLGFFVIDADETAHKITGRPPVLNNLASEFGRDIIKQNGELDRKVLSQRAFASFEKTDKLNRITHPAIIKDIKQTTNKAFLNGYDKVVVEAAALFENDFYKEFDIVVCVTASEHTRLKRIMIRDNIDEAAAKNRIGAQRDENFYAKRSDIIIVNNDDLTALDTQIKEILTLVEVFQNG
jgi:dephospho-CoA kinase